MLFKDAILLPSIYSNNSTSTIIGGAYTNHKKFIFHSNRNYPAPYPEYIKDRFIRPAIYAGDLFSQFGHFILEGRL